MRYVEYNKRLVRSGDYRKKYFDSKQGLLGAFYFCPYCGKLMYNKNKIQIDHIQAVVRIQRKKRLRRKFSALDDGVNSLSNLTACCSRCNKRKGKKGGVWTFFGRYGVYFMPIIRLALYIAILYVLFTYAIPLLF